MIHRKLLRRTLGLLCLACSLPVLAFAQAPCALLPPTNPPSPCLPPLTRGERLKNYLHSTIGLETLLSKVATSGIANVRNHPSAWDYGMEGYGLRYAHRFAKSVVSNTVRLGVESAFGEDSRYYPSPSRGAGSRMAHVFRTTFLTRTSDGGETLAVGRIAGAFSGGLISRSWQPEGHASIRQSFQSGAISYGFDFASHAFEEFFPDLRNHLPF